MSEAFLTDPRHAMGCRSLLFARPEVLLQRPSMPVDIDAGLLHRELGGTRAQNIEYPYVVMSCTRYNTKGMKLSKGHQTIMEQI